ncbi:dyslexia-associated protein KIAA0319-like protein homolog isoform X2 [Leopardus geoffroyi]|uniref:dyslexia-associated protein KIAA0319-like protein homolog isoform X2 n=1 Tax=Leopardus geoffroyi TaxID=46844 RepID=UPI001E263111|nr:dyslexia-associated protein KIAA0319-like protein homolog isoform X2 [Leopardus geoffroyi]XP_045332630.1 dyslexia-associated protein KIAA0319-like protein homolog isoform X2 [Leopardus geoffroyi]XP_045332631.1 dyslexia-associated protein KIAA0319-like protein homolog isoform X2 [Leopardus geoffroyi]
MEKRLGVKPSPASWILSGFCWQLSVKWLRSLYLFFTCFCFSALWLSTDASESRCQHEKTEFGVGLRSGGENHLRLLEGTPSLQLCWAACCQDSACHAFWWLEGMCIQADCSRPRSCQTFRTDSSNSMLVFFKKFQTADVLGYPPEEDEPHILGLGWSRVSWRRQNPLRAPLRPTVSSSDQQSLIRKLRKRDSPSEEVATHTVTQHSEMNDSKEVGDLNTSGSAEVHKAVVISSPLTTVLTAETPGWSKNVSVQPETSEDPGATPSTQHIKSPGRIQIVTPLPVAPSYSYATSLPPYLPTSQASFQSTSAPYPVIKELVVSAGKSVQITLPKNEVQLNAFVLQEPLEGETYTYDWQLITHPEDYSGEMEGKHSQILKLSKLTPGLYEFRVIVDGQNTHGEGYVNVTVKPEPRKNRPPVAIVSPQFQEISLPTTSTVIDGSQSTDDDKIVQYHWEELKGPLREEKISEDTAILKLSKLVPGNYTFSLTVVDSDGATSSTTASLTVNKAVDYPPVANAGPNQVITLPQNSIILFGNQSTDDHGITSYEWSLSPSSKGKVVEMQGVRTPTLQLSAMQEGDYTYQLTVTDTIGQQATAQVTVIVQPENNKPPQADAGPDKELTLPVDSTTLDGSKSSDDQKIISYLWEKTQGPDGVQLENANSSVATVTGLQVGTYVFTLTVKDERNLQSQSSVNVIVKEEMNKPPVAKITGSVVITLPTDTAELDGSKSSDDKAIVSYLWTRDEGSPAAGEVLNHSDHHPILFLSNLVEGTYTFHLHVTDAKGESDTDRTTVEVKPDPRKNNLVEIILDVNVSQLTERLKGMFIRQIGVLLGVLDSDIIVQKIQPYTEQSTKMVFFVQNEPPHQIFKGHEVAAMLKNELRKQKADFLIFRALEINTVTCQLNCSDHGHCDSFTKRCICDPFWMENFIKVQLRDGDSNCEWSVLYVIIASFVIVVALGILSWTVICCCKRQKGKPKRKSKYKILDATDQESLELKPTSRAGIKQKGPMLSSSLMRSESELDSDDAIFTWPDREKGKLLHGQNGSVPNGQTPLKARSPREEIL